MWFALSDNSQGFLSKVLGNRIPYAHSTPIEVDRKKPVFLNDFRDIRSSVAKPWPFETHISPLRENKLCDAMEISYHKNYMFTLLEQFLAEL